MKGLKNMIFKKGDSFTILDRDRNPMVIKIEKEPKFSKLLNTLEYKISLDGKIQRKLLQHYFLETYYNKYRITDIASYF